MASRRLEDLVPELRPRAEEVVRLARDRGVDLLIYCTLRSFEEQARLYRQSRRFSTIERKAAQLESRGFPALAQVLMGVGPQAGTVGAHVTNAGPGESWHNYGRAFDAVPLRDGKALWSTQHEEWQIYGQAARDAGLEWAGDWTRFREFPHSQLPADGNPLSVLTPEEVEEALRRG